MRHLEAASIVRGSSPQEASHVLDDGDWIWMTFMMVFWIVVLGAVVYIAVRVAQRPSGDRRH